MAKKKVGTAAPKATKKAAPKKAAPKKAAPKKAAPKKAAVKKAAPKKAVKKATAIKITEKQRDLLQKVAGAGATGYTAEKAEGRALDGLKVKKLLKSGAKDKATGKAPYLVTKAGEKALAAAAAQS